MKRTVLAVLASFCVVTLLFGCSTNSATDDSSRISADTETTDDAVSDTSETTPIVWQNYDSLELAEQAVGFDVVLPTMTLSYGSLEDYRASTSIAMLEVQYYNDGKETAYIRKAQDSDSADISGENADYTYEDSTTVNTFDVDLKGDSEDSINLALWSDSDFTYCLWVRDGLDETGIAKLVSEIK